MYVPIYFTACLASRLNKDGEAHNNAIIIIPVRLFTGKDVVCVALK